MFLRNMKLKEPVATQPLELTELRKRLNHVEGAIEYNFALGHEFTKEQKYLYAKRRVLRRAIKRLEAIERAYG